MNPPRSESPTYVFLPYSSVSTVEGEEKWTGPGLGLGVGYSKKGSKSEGPGSGTETGVRCTMTDTSYWNN